MEIKEYQKQAKRTINKDLTERDLLANTAMGSLTELGEAVDIIKKHLYQGHELSIPKIVEEVGDAMWYISNLCSQLGLDMRLVLANNNAKLVERFPTGFNVEDSINREENKLRVEVPKEIEEEKIDSPKHYNQGEIEAITVIEDWSLDFNLGNVIKYIARLGVKGTDDENLRKAQWYIERELKQRQV